MRQLVMPRLILILLLESLFLGQLLFPAWAAEAVPVIQASPLSKLGLPPCQPVYPMVVQESNVPAVPGVIIDILDGPAGSGSDLGWIAWDSQNLDADYLEYELQSPRMALTGYANVVVASDTDLSAGDYLRSLDGISAAIVPLITALEGQEIIVPVWDMFARVPHAFPPPAQVDAYQVSRFIRVQIIPGGASELVTARTISATYLGLADLSLCPELSLSKSGPLTATTGSPITYTLTVTNSGVLSATNLVITDALPPAANYVSGGSLVGDVISWTVPSLTIGESVTRTFTVTAGQTLTNSHYQVSSDQFISATGQISVVTVIEPVTPLLSPVLSLSKSGPITATAGGLITYTLKVTNSGEAPATNLVISDTVPAGASYINGGSLVGGEVIWSISSLGVNQSLSRTFSVTASRTITNSQYRVSADGAVSATGQLSIVTVIEPITPLPPILSLSKSGPITATVGGLISYTLWVTNSGETAATNLVISDTVPAGANYISGGTLVGGEVTWSIPSLGVNQSLSRTFSVTASRTIANSQYRVSADGAVSATGQLRVVTSVTGEVVRLIYLPVILK